MNQIPLTIRFIRKKMKGLYLVYGQMPPHPRWKNNNLQNTIQKTTDRATRILLKTGVNSRRVTVHTPHVHSSRTSCYKLGDKS